MMRNLDHANIPLIFDFYSDENNYYIISEFYNGGEMFEFINKNGPLNEKLALISNRILFYLIMNFVKI